MRVTTLYRYGSTVSPTMPTDIEYTTLLRVIADDGYILRLPDGTLTNAIDCESSEGITETEDTIGRQMELMGYDKSLRELEQIISDQDDALAELAALITEE